MAAYTYDRRGNRTGYVADGCVRDRYYLQGNQQADIFSYMVPEPASCSAAMSGPTVVTDEDGRGARLGTAWWYWWADLGYQPNLISGGLDTVFKSVTVSRSGAAPLNYTYSIPTMTKSVIPLLLEWSAAALRGGFVPDDCVKSVTALCAFVSGVHHGLWLAGSQDVEWAEFSAWLTQTGVARGNETPLDAVRRISPAAPLDALGTWLTQFKTSG